MMYLLIIIIWIRIFCHFEVPFLKIVSGTSLCEWINESSKLSAGNKMGKIGRINHIYTVDMYSERKTVKI